MATNLAYAYAADITKVETDENGDLIVHGRAAGPDLDADEQVCDPQWLKAAMPEWAEWSNIREMHQPICAGVGMVTEETGDGWSVKSKVLDAGTAKKINAGGLKGYSVGIKNPRVVKDTRAPGGRIVGGQIVEISYVDRPANPTAKLMICKAVGASSTLQPVEAIPTPLDLATRMRDMAELLTKHADADQPLPVPIHPPPGPGPDPVPAPEPPAPRPLLEDPEPAAPGVPADAATGGPDNPDDALTKAILAALEQHAALTADAGKGSMPPLKPGGPRRYPIGNVAELKDAIKAFGRGKDADKDKIKAHIKAEAKRLGESGLIPDSWKAALTKAADPAGTEQKHDPEELRAVLAGLVACIKAELDELLAGEDELWDIRSLLQTISGFCSWWFSEAMRGETESPYTEGDLFMGLSATPDQAKTAETTEVAPAAPAADGTVAPATETKDDEDSTDAAEDKTGAEPYQGKAAGTETPSPATGGEDPSRIAELVKSAVTEALAPSMERIKALEADLAKVSSQPEAGGPAITRTNNQDALAARTDEIHANQQIEQLLAKAALTTDMTLRRGYTDRAAVLKKSIAAA